MVLMIYLQINQENYYYCVFILFLLTKTWPKWQDSKMCSLWGFGHHQDLQFSHKNVFTKQFIITIHFCVLLRELPHHVSSLRCHTP